MMSLVELNQIQTQTSDLQRNRSRKQNQLHRNTILVTPIPTLACRGSHRKRWSDDSDGIFGKKKPAATKKKPSAEKKPSGEKKRAAPAAGELDQILKNVIQ